MQCCHVARGKRTAWKALCLPALLCLPAPQRGFTIARQRAHTCYRTYSSNQIQSFASFLKRRLHAMLHPRGTSIWILYMGLSTILTPAIWHFFFFFLSLSLLRLKCSVSITSRFFSATFQTERKRKKNGVFVFWKCLLDLAEPLHRGLSKKSRLLLPCRNRNS